MRTKQATRAPQAWAVGAALLLSFVASCKREPTKEEAKAKAEAEQRAAAALVTASASGRRAPSIPSIPSIPWIEGDLDAALVRAKESGSLVFVYWGAKWCPPCNELKAEVFTRPQFIEALRGFVPLYLDGDKEEAQRIAEGLSISAYPTILVLGPGREELLRLSGSQDAEEIERALGSVRGSAKSFVGAIEKLSSGGAMGADDCAVLAHAAWELLPDESWSRKRVLLTLQKAADVCPAESARERAMLASSLLGLASLSRGDADSAGVLRDLEGRAPVYLDLIFASADASWAARPFLLHRPSDVLAWLFSDPATEKYKQLKARWLAAVKAMSEHPHASVDQRLWCVVPALDFYRHESPTGAVPDSLAGEVKRAVARADEEAKSAAVRHAVVSGAAYLLRRVGAFEEARKMLFAEIERSDTPFYYWSGLSSLEEELGDIEKASTYSKKARETATGSASRLQWITNDLLFQAKIGKTAELPRLASEFYELALSLPDGFRGRNRGRGEQVRRALESVRNEAEVKALFARLRSRCARLSALDDRAVCERQLSDAS